MRGESPASFSPPIVNMNETVFFLVARQSSSKVFVLLRDTKAGGDTEVEFSDGKETLRLKPAPWNEHIVCVNTPGKLWVTLREAIFFLLSQMWYVFVCCLEDFPAGRVTVTVYIDGGPLSKSHLDYYSIAEEVGSLLERMMDPVDFMCQVAYSGMLASYPIKLCDLGFSRYSRFDHHLMSRHQPNIAFGECVRIDQCAGFQALQQSSLEKLDQHLSTMILKRIPRGGFQDLQCANTSEGGTVQFVLVCF